MTMTIGLLAFPQMEMLDYMYPYQVFTTAAQITETQSDKEILLVTIAETSDCFEVRDGVPLQPQATIDDHLELSCLIIPGGKAGVDLAIEGGRIAPWLEAQAMCTAILASLSTGTFLLAQTGLLNGLEATTSGEHIEELRRRFPAIDVVDRDWVESGRFLTASCSSTGVDMALHVVKRILSPEIAQATAERMK
ncbi:MAG: DJ-1/PfpI family protein [Propionibacteriaceae bacterium]|jgi:transcriptional regulator GlxA family with amidase domain|nr:DJ-1/PfpI family protein [Propionibacteriaceae bacterium]